MCVLCLQEVWWVYPIHDWEQAICPLCKYQTSRCYTIHSNFCSFLLLSAPFPGDGFWWSLSGAGHVNWGGAGTVDGSSLSGCCWGGKGLTGKGGGGGSLQFIPLDLISLIIPFHGGQSRFHSMVVNSHSIPWWSTCTCADSHLPNTHKLLLLHHIADSEQGQP